MQILRQADVKVTMEVYTKGQVETDARTAVAVEANPRAISQMPNVSSNNPPGMTATSPTPATPNSSSSVPPAKHA